MATCRECGEEVEELVSVTVKGRARRVCEECAETLGSEEQVEEGAFDAMRSMMGYKGKR